MIRKMLPIALVLALAACSQQSAPPATESAPAAAPDEPAAAPSALDAAIAGAWRTPEFVARDVYRNPKATLEFFGVRPDMTVVEIWPGGAGWYAEILAPLLRDQGRYIGAVSDPAKAASERARDYAAEQNARLRAKFEAQPEVYGQATLVEVDPAAPVFGEPGSADAVLTFRNVHNWMMGGHAQPMFDGFFAVLRPGGVLGVVEHRADQDVPEGDRSGYVSENQVIAFATAAGFVLEERSEINANPRDSKDHPNGVWTLPPTLRVPEGQDAQKYLDIGESDRMTLRFRKPAEQ
ncbi:class I SAM-dependent methyltransferase [Rehaibacterium terrae]|jgi:predicted methyltransferase|uniref:Putative methyltransferase n=1 Tax=Rehaibacterium terrae TaxID=1341696 RepID=A0A7W8DFQ9_9GAMM|nr:class I SAM-dependent methyltransferase [Rehaibacterium terrae]MBB5016459.1 putative methyltransferase [Rehaibacterium terrae]